MIREIEVRPCVVVYVPPAPAYVEWVPEEEAEFFALYVQQDDGTYKHLVDEPTKERAMLAALLYAAGRDEEGVLHTVTYRTEEGDEHWSTTSALRRSRS